MDGAEPKTWIFINGGFICVGIGVVIIRETEPTPAELKNIGGGMGKLELAGDPLLNDQAYVEPAGTEPV